MKPGTRQFIQLLKLASAPKSVTPVNSHDLLTALTNFEWELQQAMLYEPCLQTIIKDLQEAASALAAFIYISGNALQAKNSPFSKSLAERLANAYSNLSAIINSFRKQPGNDAVAIKLLPRSSFGKTLTSLHRQLSTRYAGSAVCVLLSGHITPIAADNTVSFHNWLWWSHFYYHANNALQANEPGLSELLTYCGFNCPAFISLLTDEVLNAANSKDTFNERSAFITQQLLKYKLMPMLNPHSYIPGLPSIKKTMMCLLKKQIQALPAAGNNLPGILPAPSNNFKVPVNVPVSQLALFIRLFIDAGIIKSDNHTELLKNMAAGFATPKTTIISPDSLRVNFYAPPLVAKNIVKDYLLQMMARLRTIEG